jgi:RNA polymerase sigma-70 factor (ECF subfamily)
MNDSDGELLQRWRRGDESAFADLVRRWQGPLARFLHRLAGAEQTPDLLQEVFLRVHRAADRYSDNGHFSAWLFQIALNVARDSARRRPGPTSLKDDPISGEVHAAARLELTEAAAALARGVASLPDELREVIALRHDAGLTFEEMARRLAIPATTLKSRFARALLQLRQYLHQLGHRPEDLP